MSFQMNDAGFESLLDADGHNTWPQQNPVRCAGEAAWPREVAGRFFLRGRNESWII
jgi:hypothetical protein